MFLRIYWRSVHRRRCVAELAVTAALLAPLPALAGPDAEGPERITAREAIERQFAATASGAPQMTGAEAARIMEKYHARIGKMLEPKREIGGGRAER